ncbi:CAP domain-containing protein [Rhizobium sp. Root1220]|uniref:CAP domain-containing protein n=1 Tax=Rhizobium sp. Root1220 TaxID=1736432 RepID=UPI00329880AA
MRQWYAGCFNRPATKERNGAPSMMRGSIGAAARGPTMRMLKAVALGLLISGCLGAAKPPAASGDFGHQTLTLINNYRVSRGLTPLKENATLKALARQHSRSQATRRTLGHDGFRQRSAQARAAGLSIVCSENVGVGYRNPQQLFYGWRNSPGHNTNLLRPNLRYAGVSVVGSYSTFFACQ